MTKNTGWSSKRKCFRCWWALIILLFNSCTSQYSEKNSGTAMEGGGITLCSWNLQTFFDSVKNGNEYTEFLKSENWTTDAYISRLTRLTEMMKTVDADIFVFQEMESEGIIQDIANMLAGKAWNPKYNWNYACFSKTPESSIGCAVLSKIPLVSVKNHSLDIRLYEESQPSMRPIMEVECDYNGRRFTLFVNHWKSKSGGEEETEVWRNWQESVLSKKMGKCPRALCAGDFNRDINDFYESDGNLVLRNAGFGRAAELLVENPWLWKKDQGVWETGSYVFKNEWERIDHIMAFGELTIESFKPLAQDPWCDEKKYPVPFKVYTGYGYSDHLPVWSRVSF